MSNVHDGRTPFTATRRFVRLKFHVELCCIESNVAHKAQRYINLFVGAGLRRSGVYP